LRDAVAENDITFWIDVGSKADMASHERNVRFTPKKRTWIGAAVMSAL